MKVYVDTSVFGGFFDREFSEPSKVFFDEIKRQRFTLVTSAVVQAEIAPSPENVRKLFDEMIMMADMAHVDSAALNLQESYLKEGIVTANSSNDALHVALATTAKCDLIASWNFKHIVHCEKIPKYNAINTLQGYSGIGIFSPLEVIAEEVLLQ